MSRGLGSVQSGSVQSGSVQSGSVQSKVIRLLTNSIQSSALPAGQGPTESAAAREYRLRLDSWLKRRVDLESTDRLFSRIRVGVFIFLIAVCCLAVADSTVSPMWIVLPVALFAALLRFHAPVIRKFRRAVSSERFYENCLARLEGKWKEFPADGAGFADGTHAWSGDLDTFGRGSLFQLLNQCRTLPAQRKLARWLTEVVDSTTIELRQRQTESLREQLDLRELLAGIDDTVDWQAAESAIEEWLVLEANPFPRWARWLSRFIGVAASVAFILFLAGAVPGSSVLILMLMQGPIVYGCRHRIRSVMDQVDAVDKPLRQLSEVTAQFETFPFTEKSLQQLQQVLNSDGIAASIRIEQLSRQIQWLNNSLRNQFFIPVAWATGLFIQLPHQIERWRERFGGNVDDWIEVVTTLEVLNSIAGFNYERTEYCIPQISESEITFAAKQLGHPLLSASECVRNDVILTTERPLMLISGSNMSGKSTLLRSIGTNMVLAFCGARVNADSFTAYPFQLGTAMRISDSLQEGRSLFFSVVQRLKAVVDLTKRDRPVLFLLDEILSGTNSHDRRKGAEAVIRSLVDSSALGLVTTHDLTLTQIVDSMSGKAVNIHFEDQIDTGQMSFDYKLREGVVQRSNAIELMRMMGLDV